MNIGTEQALIVMVPEASGTLEVLEAPRQARVKMLRLELGLAIPLITWFIWEAKRPGGGEHVHSDPARAGSEPL